MLRQRTQEPTHIYSGLSFEVNSGKPDSGEKKRRLSERSEFLRFRRKTVCSRLKRQKEKVNILAKKIPPSPTDSINPDGVFINLVGVYVNPDVVYINPDGIYRFYLHKDNFPTQGSPSFSRHNFMFYAAKHEASIRIA